MLKKPNILVVGSFMMDLIASTKRAPNSGETVIGLKFQTAPGGKGANQAVQCARLGAHVTMVGQVGDDAFGKIMTDTAAAAGVDVSHVSVDPQESSGVGHITLEVTEHGAQNRITVCPGANFTITVDDVAWLREEIGRFDLVMMQFELPMEVIEAVAQWAHDAGVPVMINPAPAAPMSDRLLACATYLSPNEHEAAILAGHSIDVSNGINMEDVAGGLPGLPGPGGGEPHHHHGGKRLHRGGERRHPSHPLREDGACGRPHGRRRLLCGRLLHRPHRRSAPGRGPGFCQPHRRHHRVPYGRHAQPAHGGGGPAAPCGAGLPGL